MKYSLLSRFTVLAAVALLSSCQDDEGDATNLLESKTWKRTLVDKNPATNPSANVGYDPVANCQKDDTYRFGTDGTLTIWQGLKKCNSSEPFVKSVPYSYDRNTKKIVIDGITYTMAEESRSQIKYYAITAAGAGYSPLIFLLE